MSIQGNFHPEQTRRVLTHILDKLSQQERASFVHRLFIPPSHPSQPFLHRANLLNSLHQMRWVLQLLVPAEKFSFSDTLRVSVVGLIQPIGRKEMSSSENQKPPFPHLVEVKEGREEAMKRLALPLQPEFGSSSLAGRSIKKKKRPRFQDKEREKERETD